MELIYQTLCITTGHEGTITVNWVKYFPQTIRIKICGSWFRDFICVTPGETVQIDGLSWPAVKIGIIFRASDYTYD